MTIKELRRTTGLSQSKFAKEFGISVRTLQQWEQNISNPPVYLVPLLERVMKAEGKFFSDSTTETPSNEGSHDVKADVQYFSEEL